MPQLGKGQRRERRTSSRLRQASAVITVCWLGRRLKPTLLLVHAWGSLPVDDADELPRAADQVHLQLSVLVQDELRGGIENACAFGFIFIVQIDLASGEIVGFRAGVPVHFAEAEKAI